MNKGKRERDMCERCIYVYCVRYICALNWKLFFHVTLKLKHIKLYLDMFAQRIAYIYVWCVRLFSVQCSSHISYDVFVYVCVCWELSSRDARNRKCDDWEPYARLQRKRKKEQITIIMKEINTHDLCSQFNDFCAVCWWRVICTCEQCAKKEYIFKRKTTQINNEIKNI